MKNTIIIGSGSYIPEIEVENTSFMKHPFSFNDGRKVQNSNTEVITKFEENTGIQARRYARQESSCSEIASISAQKAIEDAGIDPETLDMIIIVHNFGDVISGSNQTDIVPSIGARVEHGLGIKNPFCVPYDIIFGCPGWVQGLIQAHIHIQAGEAKRCLIVGSEVLSRVVDPFDRDTMIFTDGARAVVMKGKEEGQKYGVLGHATVSHSLEEKEYLYFGKSFNRFGNEPTKFIKMKGHKIYQYALTEVPKAMKYCLDKVNCQSINYLKMTMHCSLQ